jgi:toxin HigB-1
MPVVSSLALDAWDIESRPVWKPMHLYYEITEASGRGPREPYPGLIYRQAYKRLVMLNRARSLMAMATPGNRLEALRGDRAGQYSIRINRQWRICFRWDDGPRDVQIVDYH